MAVQNLGSLDPAKIHGEDEDGYSYQWVQATDTGMIYQIQPPEGDAKLACLSESSEVNALVDDPHGFYNKYLA